MKKILLSTLMIAFVAVYAQAQVIISENFDSYASGDKIAQTAGSPWTTWSNAPGGGEDGTVSSKYASSGTNSLFIAKDNDCVLLLGDSTTGAYEFTLKLYTPSDSCTYFNILHSFAGSSSVWAFDFYGLRDSTLHMVLQGNDTLKPPPAYLPNTWHDFKLEVNMDNDQARLSVDGNMVFEWPWTMTGGDTTTGTTKLGGADFYGYDLYSDGGVGTFIDDIKLEKMSTVSFNTSSNEVSLDIYPNPTSNILNIESSEAIQSISVYNIAGAMVLHQNTQSELVNLDMSLLTNGLYYVSLNYGDKIIVKKVVKN